jgi:hypothetical protein
MIGSAIINARPPAAMLNLLILSLSFGLPGFLELTIIVRLLVKRESLIQNALKALDAFLLNRILYSSLNLLDYIIIAELAFRNNTDAHYSYNVKNSVTVSNCIFDQ